MLAGVFEDFEPGYLIFVGVKLVGYSIAGYALNRAYANLKRHFLVVGLVRTLIGLAIGSVFGWMTFTLENFVQPRSEREPKIWGLEDDELGMTFYFVALALIRLFEWRAVIWLFYDRQSKQPKKDWLLASCGVAWSFALDVPAIIGVISVSGIHVC
jgi:hypothetical protein